MILMLVVLAWLVLSLPVSLVIGKAMAFGDADTSATVEAPAPVRDELAAA